MVKRVFGKVDGIEVNYDHSKGDWWNVPVPLDIDGEYVIEVIAEDEAGNQSFITRLLYTVKGENICVHQLPLSGYLFDKVERKLYFVHSVDQYDYFAIKEANFSLLHNGKEEAAGVCTIERDEEKNGYYVDTKIQPMQKSRMYTLEIELKIADEIIKNKEMMEVI